MILTCYLVWEVLQPLLAGIVINLANQQIFISFVFVSSLTRLHSGSAEMTHPWLNQYCLVLSVLLFDFIKTSLITSETRMACKANIGHSLIIHFCVFF